MIFYMKISVGIIWIACALFLGACENGISQYPKISGHRGARYIAPENTLASIDSCIRYGIDLAECDVCISKDSVFYLMHDSTLDRTTNASGAISKWMSQDIDTLDAGSWFNPSFKGQRVPRLVDVLRRVKQTDLDLTIDYRSGGVKKLLDLIRYEGMLERCTFIFSSEEELKTFRAQAPDVKRIQAYLRQAKDLDHLINELKPDIMVVQLDSVTTEIVSRCHSAGIEVLALALKSPDLDENYHRAIRLGIDIFATDRPEYIVKKFGMKRD